jgi:hypothetical protein
MRRSTLAGPRAPALAAEIRGFYVSRPRAERRRFGSADVRARSSSSPNRRAMGSHVARRRRLLGGYGTRSRGVARGSRPNR